MLRFILRKLISKKWMAAALLIGDILLVGIACANPLYTSAVMQRTLTDELESYLETKNVYPGLITMQVSGSVKRNAELASWRETADGLSQRLLTPLYMQIEHLYLTASAAEPEVERSGTRDVSMALGALSDFENHIQITAGRLFSSEKREDGTVEVMVSKRALVELDLLLGERRTFKRVTDKGTPVTIEVVGVYEVLNEDDAYWVRQPYSYRTECLMDIDLFKEMFTGEDSEMGVNAVFYRLLNFNEMQAENAEQMKNVCDELKLLSKDTSYLSISISFADILTSHITVARKVRVTLWVLNVPVYILLAAFIFMVSGRLIESEEAEIAVLKSRGVSGGRITGMYLMQSVIMALIALIAGLPLGSFITQALGSASAFMVFVSRSALPVETDTTAILYALAAALLSIAAMTVPAARSTRATIVEQKRKKHKSSRPLWQKTFIDVILLGVSLYGLYSFNKVKDSLAADIIAGGSPDPLMLLSSSLFIIGAGLLCIRLMPLIIKAVFALLKPLMSPALYISFIEVIRRRKNQDFIQLFLIMTIALGIYSATAAQSINTSAENSTRYLLGADMVIAESWQSNSDEASEDSSVALVYYEPDFGVYEDFGSAAKVYTYGASQVSFDGGTLKNVTLMAFDTYDFGNTVWFDSSLLPRHINEYLNAMSQNARAVIVSSNFRDRGCRIGDAISYTAASGVTARGIIYGFVDYWPGFETYSYQKGSDGLYTETENFLVAANLSQVQDLTGVLPYSVWLKTDDADKVYAWAEASGRSFKQFDMASELVAQKKNEPMLKSLNGVLTVGFIVVLTLSFLGFLIYWVLSIKQRTLVFGIYRAMGMRMREIITLLINEQVWVSLTSIAAGAALGVLAGRLYLPIIRIAYATSDMTLPLTSEISVSGLPQAVGAMLVIGMTVLVGIVKRLNIAGALKLGED